jgi:hypothetical protein
MPEAMRRANSAKSKIRSCIEHVFADQNLEHHHRIERRAATLRTIRIRKVRVEVQVEHLEIYRHPESLELITKITQTLQAIVYIEKARLPTHGIISDPTPTIESEKPHHGELFRSLQLRQVL